MSFAQIVKKRNADLWLVSQVLPMPDGGGFASGDIVFQGPGSVEIARLIRECYRVHHTVVPTNQGRLYPVPAALGYKSYQAVVRYTHRLDIWEDEKTGAIYGYVGTGGTGYALAHVDLADSAAQMDMPGWDAQTWGRIQVGFQYAEQSWSPTQMGKPCLQL